MSKRWKPKWNPPPRSTWVRQRDVAGTPAAMDSPVTKAVLTPIEQVEREAAAIMQDRALGFTELRSKYPLGWLNAPYVPVPAKLAAALTQ